MRWLESDYYLAFHYSFGIGPQRLQLIKKYFNNLKTAWNARDTVWQ